MNLELIPLPQPTSHSALDNIAASLGALEIIYRAESAILDELGAADLNQWIPYAPFGSATPSP